MKKLNPEDLPSLRKLVKLARAKESADLHFDGVQAALVLQDIRAAEKHATPAALQWWQNAPSAKLASELKRWVIEYRWSRTRAGWRACRFLKGRRCYASRPCIAGEQTPGPDIWIRV